MFALDGMMDRKIIGRVGEGAQAFSAVYFCAVRLYDAILKKTLKP